MHRLSTRLILLACGLSLTLPAAAQQAPQVGSCVEGSARRDIDVNNVRASLFNTGSLFFGAASDAAQYVVPASGGASPIYATGIWIGGRVDGELRVAGSLYENFEFWPGPLDATGRPASPTDCQPYDRIYKVSRSDIATFESTGQAALDLAQWPANLGAPVIAAPDNGTDDDGDGLTDEGTNGLDDDSDGNVDERDEQERRTDGGYELAAGDRPDIIGDQGLWWVMNDVGNVHAFSLTPPLGVEVQVLAWAFARADALGDATFYRYRIINKSGFPINETYLTIFSDPDLGGSDDDFIGIDTTLSLGFVFNGDEDDATVGGIQGYGSPPPAAGYDFFQGPIVNGDTLGATAFTYFNNDTTPLGNPDDGIELNRHQRGLWRDGTTFNEGGNGYGQSGAVTTFAYPGDPVTAQFWSEENTGSGGRNAPSDRRLVISTGPFTLEANVPQDIVFGLVFATGSSRLSSVSALRAADQTAQAAYDADFELASPPPPPPLCDVDSPNPELLPGSGRCAEVIESDRQVTLIWGYPSNQNILGSRVRDRLVTDPADDPFYDFEGFNIYRYPDARFRTEDRELLATFDRETGPGQVIDFRLDPATGAIVPFIAARGTNSGVQFTYDVPNLTNYTDVYYGITAYSYNDDSVPKVIESSATLLTGRPSQITASGGGSTTQSEYGALIRGTFISGVSAAPLDIRVVDPTSVIAATYRIEFFNIATGDSTTTTYRILRNGQTVYDGAQVRAETNSVFVPGSVVSPVENVMSNRIIIDGLEFFTTSLDGIPIPAADADGVADISGDGRGVLEISYPGSANTCPDPSSPTDYGCVNYNNIGNSVATATTFTGPEGNINDDYFVTTGTGTLTGGTGIIPIEEAAAGHQFEIRFTAEGSLAIQQIAVGANNTRTIYRVPFEVWNVGQRANDPADDVRMIPTLSGVPTGVTDWTNQFPRTITVGGVTYPQSIVFFGYMPDRPNGYDLFAQDAANLFGGPGGTYVRATDGDTQDDLSGRPGTPVCARQDFYIDFCYRDELYADPINISGAYPIGNLTFGDLARDGTTPPIGTVVRIRTAPAATSAQPGDVYEFNTADFAFVQGDEQTAEEALDLIGITPNPYFGASAYETGNIERIARFTNVPQQATIRIYTVSGSLIRTITKDGPSRSVDWDLATESGLPVASGMYLIHVDVPGVGDRVLKFGVINRTTQIDVF